MDDNLFADYDYEQEYPCSRYTKSSHFTKLMYLIINSNKIGYDTISTYIFQLSKEEINKQNSKGWSALMIASRNSNINNNIEIVKILLKNGAEINDVLNLGGNALMLAARYSNTDSNIETVKLLLKNKADINKADINGYSVLMHTIYDLKTHGNIETVELLLENRADIDKANNDGITVLMLSVRNSNINSNIETVRLLLENKADIDKVDNDGMTGSVKLECQLHSWRNPYGTALMYAAANYGAYIGIVQLLLDYGANINLENHDGITFLNYINTNTILLYK
jgi:ankyrin repeat protein